jgi:CMP-N,N'-diacetyllegionaminic acid synthase
VGFKKDFMKTLAVITARGGSKGFPRKNIQHLLGKPLIAYTFEAAKNSKLISRIILSTDDLEIANVARSLGIGIPFIRPPELASDYASQVDVVLHALETIERTEGIRFEVLLLLQPTTPLRTASDIDSSLEKLFESGADSVISVYRVEHGHPYYMYTLDGDRPLPLLKIASQTPRRQDFPLIYVRNGAIYATRRESLTKYRSLLGPDTRAYIMPFERSINIDTEFDLSLAEFLLRQQILSR